MILGVTAIGLGIVVGVALFIPFVAVSYRRRGRLSVGRMLLWAAALVYFWAIWTYTLLPLPDPSAMRCAGVNLDVWAFVGDIRTGLLTPGNPLTHPAILQLALNVLLFVPLGFFLRVLGGRGILTAVLVGLGTSLLIETTQVTGVWGVYPCAYRVFDVDDLLTNTVGAAVGSLIALAVPRPLRGMPRAADADVPRPVTRRRRLLAMLCDALGMGIVQGTVAVAVQLVLIGTGSPRGDGDLVSVVAALTGAAVWLVVVGSTGGSVGDLVVRLRYAGGPLPEPLARLLRYVAGVSGYVLLGLLPGSWAALAPLFAVVAVATALFTRSGRGLPGLVTGRRLDDARGAVDPVA